MQLFNQLVAVTVRRRDWGAPTELAARARRMLGAPAPYSWIRSRGLQIEPVREEHVRGEWLSTHSRAGRPSDGAVVLYIHGGGYVACSPVTHRPIAGALARLSGARVFSVDYRLAPEHRFPAAIDDVTAAYQWLLASGVDPRRLAIAGDSAGGGLALSLLASLRAAGKPLPACAVLFSPWTDLTGSFDSIHGNDGRCPMFRPENMKQFADCYVSRAEARDPRASPAFAELRGLPPVLFQVGSTELLLDDSRRVAQKILNAGGVAELEIFSDAFHCWQMLNGLVPEADAALCSASTFITRHSSSNTPCTI